MPTLYIGKSGASLGPLPASEVVAALVVGPVAQFPQCVFEPLGTSTLLQEFYGEFAYLASRATL
jgi:hypothetical protein